MSSLKIIIFTDGACKDNPGPGAWAVLIMGIFPDDSTKTIIAKWKTVAGYFEGETTNNKMELAGIKNALSFIRNPKDHDIILYCDSNWALNACGGNYNLKVNVEQVKEIQDIMIRFKSVKFMWIKGHGNNWWNEKCDTLANHALKTRSDLPMTKIKEEVFPEDHDFGDPLVKPIPIIIGWNGDQIEMDI